VRQRRLLVHQLLLTLVVEKAAQVTMQQLQQHSMHFRHCTN
jgi:hypothetical protein